MWMPPKTRSLVLPSTRSHSHLELIFLWLHRCSDGRKCKGKCLFFNCGKIHIKFTILTIFKCAGHWHGVHPHCCGIITTHQNIVYLTKLKVDTQLILTPLFPTPSSPWQPPFYLVSVSVTIPATSYQWNHTVFSLF